MPIMESLGSDDKRFDHFNLIPTTDRPLAEGQDKNMKNKVRVWLENVVVAL